MIRVVVVDDHVVVRSGLEQLLATTDDIQLVGMASNGLEAIDLVADTDPETTAICPTGPAPDTAAGSGKAPMLRQ